MKKTTHNVSKRKTVITYGTFDLTHIGHLNLLRRARALGDYLIVALSTDEFNAGKGKVSLFPYEHRKKILESICYVDKVIPEKNWEQKVKDVRKYGVDVFVMGDDWKGKFDFLKKQCKVVYLPRTKEISTTLLKKRIRDEAR
jgi:glycerol-3-phosphate cytidylyltransferase